MNFNEFPPEVVDVWAMQRLVKYSGKDQIDWMQSVIDKYPEYFKDEHAYKSIPVEVHEQYQIEADKLRQEFYPTVIEHIPGEGIIGYMKRLEEYNSKKPEMSMKECLNKIFVKDPAKREEYKKQQKTLWDKFYKKYGINYDNII